MKTKVLSVTLVILTITYSILFLWYYTDTQKQILELLDTKEIIHQIDTIITNKTDTIYYGKPIYTTKTVLTRDTIKLDTILTHEMKKYQDSTYIAYVSGIEPSLDSIYIFEKEKIIEINNNIETIKYKNKKLSIGPLIGITYNGNKPEMYIGIGLQYNLINFK